MISCSNSNQSIVAKLSASASPEVQFVCTYILRRLKIPGTIGSASVDPGYTIVNEYPVANNGLLAGTSEVAIVSAPTANTAIDQYSHELEQLSFYNPSGSSQVITVYLKSSSTNYTIAKCTVANGHHLKYESNRGWYSIDENGRELNVEFSESGLPALTDGSFWLGDATNTATEQVFSTSVLAVAPAETASSIGVIINGASAAVPNDTDLVATAASSVVKKITWTNVKAFLKTYFDTIYQSALGYTAENTANKSSSYTVSSTTTYANTKALVDGLATKQDALGFTPANVANNLSDLANPATALTNLGGTTVGVNVFKLTNPSAVRFLRVNADNTVTALDASTFFTAVKQSASESDSGAIEIATQTETNTGTDDARAVTPLKLETYSVANRNKLSVYNYIPYTLASSTSELVTHSLKINGGIVSANDIIEIYSACATNNSAGTKTFRMYIHSSAGTPGSAPPVGSTLVATGNTITTTTANPLSRVFPVLSSTTIRAHGGATGTFGSQYGVSAAATATVTTPDFTSDTYIIITAQKGTAGDTATTDYTYIKIHKA